MFKRKAVSFNLDCPHQRALYEHCETHPNFSGYVKSVLFLHLRSQNNNFTERKEPTFLVAEVQSGTDKSLVADLL